jgi:hypothetical protein
MKLLTFEEKLVGTVILSVMGHLWPVSQKMFSVVYYTVLEVPVYLLLALLEASLLELALEL